MRDGVTSIAMLCAWCGALMREGPLVDQGASHGICAECLEFRREAPPAPEEPRRPR